MLLWFKVGSKSHLLIVEERSLEFHARWGFDALFLAGMLDWLHFAIAARDSPRIRSAKVNGIVIVNLAG
jgi:hypothetical protein